jgi:hypothetical protein
MNWTIPGTLALAVGLVAVGFTPSYDAKGEFDGGTQAGTWQFAATARAQSGPVGDIVGLEPGMDFDTIVSLIKKREDIGPIETAEQWIRQNHGVPTRQLLRAADGTSCAEGEGAQPSGGHILCNTFGGRFEARKDITNEIVVAFVGMPEKETAGSLWRRNFYPDGANPTVSGLEEALAEKYGMPHIRQTESGYYSTTHRTGAINLNWVYAPNGSPITNNDSLKQRCVNGPKPWFTTNHSWNGGCGLTVRAEILPVPGNRLLAQELHITVVHQKDLIAALGQFDTELKAAVEKQAGGKAKKQDL